MKKRWFAAVLSAAVLIGQAAAVTYSDISGTGAEAAISKWSDYGVIKGNDGLFRPDAGITRGELAVILDRVMGYRETAANTFSDLPAGLYCTEAMLKLNQAGIMTGADGKCRPNEQVNRQEALVLLARVLGLSGGPDLTFQDKDRIASWAQPAIEGLVSRGLIAEPNGVFGPQEKMTRVQVVQLLDRAVGKLIQGGQIFTGDVTGDAVIRAPGALLKDMTVTGDVILAEGAAGGETTLENVTVTGRVIVRGGSLQLKNAVVPAVSVEASGAVGIAASGGSISQMDISGGGNVLTLAAKVNTLRMQGAQSTLKTDGAEIGTLTVTGLMNTVELDSTTSVDRLAVLNADTQLKAEDGAFIEAFDNVGGAAANFISNAIGSSGQSGDLIVRSSQTYKDETFGNVTIDASVGDGSVRFNNVRIRGNLTIKGGSSSDAVVISGNSSVDGNVIINKEGGKAPCLVLSDRVRVDNISALSDAIIERGTDAAGRIKKIKGTEGKTLTLLGVSVSTVEAEGPVKTGDRATIDTINAYSTVEITESTIDTLSLRGSAVDVSISGNTHVRTLTVESSISQKPVINLSESGRDRPVLDGFYVDSDKGARLTGRGYLEHYETDNKEATSIASTITDYAGHEVDYDTDDYYVVTFRLTPSDASVTMKSDKGGLMQVKEGVYKISKEGSFSYEAWCYGYQTVTGSFLVSQNDIDNNRSRIIDIDLKKN